MKTVFYIILGLLISTFMSGNLLSPVVSYKADAVYAMGPNPGKTDPNSFRNHRPDRPASSVPEPSTLASLGAGAAGIGIYLYSRRNKKK